MNFVCTPVDEPDDSGCDPETVAIECELYSDILCTGAQIQDPPGQCPASCTTDDECSEGNVCSSSQGCEPVICGLSGNQDEVVDCALNLARETLDYDPAVGLQLVLVFDESIATPVSVQSCGLLDPPFEAVPCTLDGTTCTDFGVPGLYCNADTLTCQQCKTIPVAETGTLVTGHAVVTCAQPPNSNCEDNKLTLLFWGLQSMALNTAYMSGGDVVGNTEFVTVKFKLLSDQIQEVPVTVSSTDEFKTTNTNAKKLPVEVLHMSPPNPAHIMVTGPAPVVED